MRNSLLAIMLAGGIVSGCGVLSPVPVPETKQFQIVSSVPAVENCKANPDAQIMQVFPVKVASPFDNKYMYYSESQYQLSSYALNQWVSSPGQMFTQAVHEKLQGSCLYKNVISAEFMVTAKYRLTVQVMDFEQIISGGSATMNMSVIVQMIDNNSNQVIKGKTFVETANVTPDVNGYIQGANQVTQAFTSDLTTWLSSAN